MMMKSPAIVINVLAIFFVVLGVAWYTAIQVRCAEIAPKPVLTKAVSVGTSVAGGPVVKKIRSPHAKWYHDYIFGMICNVEVFTAVFYTLAGIFLLKRFVLARFITYLALSLDIVLKTTVILFMKFGTIPLSQMTHNPNLLQLYFLPSPKIHNSFSIFVTGYKFYLPGGLAYGAAVMVYFAFVFYFLSRPEIKNYLMRKK